MLLNNIGVQLCKNGSLFRCRYMQTTSSNNIQPEGLKARIEAKDSLNQWRFNIEKKMTKKRKIKIY